MKVGDSVRLAFTCKVIKVHGHFEDKDGHHWDCTVKLSGRNAGAIRRIITVN